MVLLHQQMLQYLYQLICLCNMRPVCSRPKPGRGYVIPALGLYICSISSINGQENIRTGHIHHTDSMLRGRSHRSSAAKMFRIALYQADIFLLLLHHRPQWKEGMQTDNRIQGYVSRGSCWQSMPTSAGLLLPRSFLAAVSSSSKAFRLKSTSANLLPSTT